MERATLKLLLQKGIITQAEFDAALSGQAPAATASPLASLLHSKWDASFYGFLDFDAISDSTQSFNDIAGSTSIARPDTYAGTHGRLTFGVRNSRLGFKVTAPEFMGVKASGIAEMDFLGNQPTTSTEFATFSSPTFRLRHFMVKLESPYVDVIVGQYWELFGWQPFFDPNTVQIQGIPGELFARTAQLRLSHTFKGGPVDVEIAASAQRPPQRDSWVPDGQAGIRLLVNKWKGVRTIGSTGTQADALGIGLSGTVRRFDLPVFSATPTSDVATLGWGVSADAMIPIIPRSLEDRGNALTLTGSFTRGEGIGDLYTNFSGGGVTFPALPNPNGTTPAPAYAADVDNGLVTFGPDGQLHAVGWQSFLLGAQYYLPPSGRFWVAAHYSQMRMTNPAELGIGAKVYTQSQFADGNVFCDVTNAFRLGLEYAWFQQRYSDGTFAKDHRVQLSAFYIF